MQANEEEGQKTESRLRPKLLSSKTEKERSPHGQGTYMQQGLNSNTSHTDGARSWAGISTDLEQARRRQVDVSRPN